MRKKRSKLKTNIYPILWSGIIVISLYLLIRFAALSFSDDFGQANRSFQEAICSRVYSKAMEESSGVVRYTANDLEDTSDFLLSIVTDDFALRKFVKNDSTAIADTQEYSSVMNNFEFKLGKSSVQTQEDETDQELSDEQTDIDQSVEQTDAFNIINQLEADQNDITDQDNDIEEGIGFYEIKEGYLTSEYILTNGAVLSSSFVRVGEETVNQDISSDQLDVGFLKGNVYFQEIEDNNSTEDGEAAETLNPEASFDYTMEQLSDISFLVKNFYIVDKSTKVTDTLFDAKKLLGKDMTIKQKNDAPQILIYHTHSRETYVDSEPGKEADTVVGVGNYLAKILKEEYGYNVIHDKTPYDIVDGKEDRNVAYNQAEEGLTKILEENPTIEVIIDIHRDDGNDRSVVINGEKTAQIMLFNGLSRNQSGPILHLENPYLQDNLAFSLQLQLKSKGMYPGLFIKNYLKCYRYNLHFRPKSILIELGTDENTVESAKNTMIPFAEILDSVLKGK